MFAEEALLSGMFELLCDREWKSFCADMNPVIPTVSHKTLLLYLSISQTQENLFLDKYPKCSLGISCVEIIH